MPTYNWILISLGATIGVLTTLVMVKGPAFPESIPNISDTYRSVVEDLRNKLETLTSQRNVSDSENVGSNSNSVGTTHDVGSAPDSVLPDVATRGGSQDQNARLIQELSASLKQKMDDAGKDMKIVFKSCKERNIKNYDDTCRANRTCLNTSIPENLEERIQNLAFPPNMRIPDRYWDILESMRNKVNGTYDMVIVHAISANHFEESQALLNNLHKKVFPLLSNFKLVVYDLGLTKEQRVQYAKHCNCSLLSFPFHQLPEHFHHNLRTFSWKVFVIAAHYEQAELTMWLDASIRVEKTQRFLEIVEKARKRGVMQRSLNRTPNPDRTLPQMFEAFGDSPCAHASFKQVETGFGIYHREPLIRHALIKPWVACASNPYCMAPLKQSQHDGCNDYKSISNGWVGACMRSDQSALSIVLAKLFRKKMTRVLVNPWSFSVTARGQVSTYFADLEKEASNIVE